MRDYESDQPLLRSCIKAIEEFRARLNLLERELKHTRDRLGGLLTDMPPAGTSEYEARRREIARLSRLLADLEVAHAHALSYLRRLEAECHEKRAESDGAPADERSLRNAMDDPRYWRDGDPALARYVSDGFKRLYPDDSEG